MQKKIVYEQPLNERTRTLLRLEHLFLYCDFQQSVETEAGDRAVINGLLEVLNVISLSDVKSELIKELEGHVKAFNKMKYIPEVDTDRLQIFLDSLGAYTDALHKHKGQIAGDLRRHGFINSIQQRATIPGGLCAFDVPFFHYWLQRPSSERHKDIKAWFSEFKIVRQSVDMLLHLIRSSGQTTQEIAVNGLFQQSLDSSKTCPLVRISVPVEELYYAEISGGKHRVSVRFVSPINSNGERSEHVRKDITFEYSPCIMR